MSPGTTFLWLALLVGGSGQDQRPSVPEPSEVSYAYQSTALLLDPCGAEDRGDWTGNDTQRAIDEARARFPPGTCEAPGMRELLFRARFLQAALIADSIEPWHVFGLVEAQQRNVAACRDIECLRQRLTDVSEQLSSLYGSALDTPVRTRGFCDVSEFVELPAVDGLLSQAVLEMLEEQCVGDFTLASCQRKPELLWAHCAMGGVQVNAPEWVWQSTPSGSRQLLYSDNGPFLVLPGNCNGMPDVMTSARSSMGESYVTHYRYDGVRYQRVFSYIRESIGETGAVARYPEPGALVICH